MPTILWLAVQVRELQSGEFRCSAAKSQLPVLLRLKASSVRAIGIERIVIRDEL